MFKSPSQNLLAFPSHWAARTGRGDFGIVSQCRTIKCLAAMALLALGLSGMRVLMAEETAPIKFTVGNEADLQSIFDKAPAGSVIVCEQAKPLVVSRTLVIRKPMTLRGLKANLPEKLGKTPVLSVEAEGVTLAGLEMQGNYDSVPQNHRAPMIRVKCGEFCIERCKFRDTTKDGIMVTPDPEAGDIVGGTIRNIEGERIGRDLVSISGGNRGQRIRNVSVENVRLKKGYLRGAVEVSDGTDNVTVRHVYAEQAVYAIDVQDHASGQKKTPETPHPCSPNTNITLEDVVAVDCRHAIRTANHAGIKHAHLTLRNFTARNCSEPFRISNTAHVLAEDLTIVNDPAAEDSRICLQNVQDVVIRRVTVQGLRDGVDLVKARSASDVTLEKVTGSNRNVGSGK